VFTATAADVSDVIVDGRQIVQDGRHLLVGDVSRALTGAIEAAWQLDPADT
jgi:cytosine/adenosine deaminase-related metal-dependent hydrolase